MLIVWSAYIFAWILRLGHRLDRGPIPEGGIGLDQHLPYATSIVDSYQDNIDIDLAGSKLHDIKYHAVIIC